MQVTVEIRVEPKPRTHWPSVFNTYRSRSTTEHPSHPALFDCRLYECVSSKPAPCFQFWSNTLVLTDHRDQITLAAAAQHSDQLRQQAGGESLSPNFQIDVSLHFQGGPAQSANTSRWHFVQRTFRRLCTKSTDLLISLRNLCVLCG